LQVSAGDGTVAAPDGETVVGPADGRAASGGLAGAFADASAGEGVLLFLLAAAFGWGALHALSPGHGKAMVAAYLVGTRGTPRDAVALGGIVTVTHTIGVFALGLVTLALSAYVLPEQLYPWLNVVAGVLVVLVGVAVLRGRVRGAAHHGHHDHHHHDHHHHHHHQQDRRDLLAMGASAGLIPCPSALVVLLAAIAQAQVALGLALIVAFSLGLAATLTALGLAVVWAGRAAGRVRLGPRAGAVAAALPAVSAAVIIVAGLTLTAQALPQLT
jgi:ABC-type nickel/cobalt efflux system permease component RcnA